MENRKRARATLWRILKPLEAQHRIYVNRLRYPWTYQNMQAREAVFEELAGVLKENERLKRENERLLGSQKFPEKALEGLNL